MLHYRDITFCADSKRCATVTCHRHWDEYHDQWSRELDLPVAWAGFAEDCTSFKEIRVGKQED